MPPAETRSAKADEPAAQGSSQEIQSTNDSLAESAQAITLAEPNGLLGSPVGGDHNGDRAIQLMHVLTAACKLASLMRAKVVSSAAESAQRLFSRAIHFLLPDVMNGLALHAPQVGHADDSQEVERLCISVVQVIMPGFGQTVKIIKQMTDGDLRAHELSKLNQSVTHEECCLSTLQMLLISGHQQHRMIAANEMSFCFVNACPNHACHASSLVFVSVHPDCAGHAQVAADLVTNFCALHNHCLTLPMLHKFDIPHKAP